MLICLCPPCNKQMPEQIARCCSCTIDLIIERATSHTLLQLPNTRSSAIYTICYIYNIYMHCVALHSAVLQLCRMQNPFDFIC